MKHEPATKTAFLPLKGTRRATKHVYSHSELVQTDAGVALGHFFRCTETGEMRLWGAEATFAQDNGGN